MNGLSCFYDFVFRGLLLHSEGPSPVPGGNRFHEDGFTNSQLRLRRGPPIQGRTVVLINPVGDAIELIDVVVALRHEPVHSGNSAVLRHHTTVDVEASRDVYQSFLKRSRETEEQESLNTSSARIIGEATIPPHNRALAILAKVVMAG